MYQALYRKWRPRSFDDVIGQTHITETLKRQVASGHTAHAYLFTGTRGTGKTTCAKILARAVNCEHPVDGNPCNACPSCLGIESGAILDVTEMDAASNNKVEDVRALREEAVYTPAAVRRRVYIVDEVHMLSTSAFNALLKIMEEPPEHLMFILATTELHKVPATILSRCQRFSFRRILPEDIVSRLQYVAQQEQIPLTDEAAALLARLSDGAMRDALSLMDQCRGAPIDRARVLSIVGLAENSELLALYRSITAGDGFSAVSAFARLYANGKEVSSVLDMLASLYRDLCIFKLNPAPGGNLLSGLFTDAELAELAAGAEMPALLASLERIHKTQSELDRTPDRRAAAELCLLTLSGYTAALPQQPVYIAPPPVRAEAPAPSVKQPPAPTPELESQPIPEPPKHAPEPEPAPAEPEPGERHFSAAEFLRALNGRLDFSYYVLIDNSANVELRCEGQQISILVKDPFSLEMLSKEEPKKAVAQLASELYGGEYSVRVASPSEEKSQQERKFDELDRILNQLK